MARFATNTRCVKTARARSIKSWHAHGICTSDPRAHRIHVRCTDAQLVLIYTRRGTRSRAQFLLDAVAVLDAGPTLTLQTAPVAITQRPPVATTAGRAHRHTRGDVAETSRKFGRSLARYRCAEPGCQWISDWQPTR